MNALTKRISAVATAIAIAAVPAVAIGQDGPLVTADWLQDNLNNPNVRIFEVSVDTGVYERGWSAP